MDAKLELSGWAPEYKKGYWPTERYRISREELPPGYKGMHIAMENPGFFQDRTYSNKNPYVIRDFVSVLSKYNHTVGVRSAGTIVAVKSRCPLLRRALVSSGTFPRLKRCLGGASDAESGYCARLGRRAVSATIRKLSA